MRGAARSVLLRGGMRDSTRIYVCSECLCAACWHGEFMCKHSRNGSIVTRTVGELRGLDREHPDHWRAQIRRGWAPDNPAAAGKDGE